MNSPSPSEPPLPPPRGLGAALERHLADIAKRASGAPKTTLIVLLALAAVSLLGARRLRLDTDLAHLLPEHAQSVRDLDALEQRSGGVGFISIIGEGAPPEALARFADDLAPKIEALDEIRYVDAQRPEPFFRDRGLYFLELADLTTITDRIEARIAWERRQRNPMLMDLDEPEPAPSLDFSEIEAKYRDRQGLRTDGALLQADDRPEAAHYLDPVKGRIALLARPMRRATDLSNSAEAIAAVRRVIDATDLSQYGPNLSVQLSGRFVKQIAQKQQLQKDLGASSIWSLALMLLYLAVHFRRLRAVALVILPLVLGLVWTFGFAGVAFGTLNLLTAFIGAILMGLGIDHGIHLLGRFDHERDHGASIPEAIDATFSHTGRAVIVAALTTTVAFFGLGTSDFRAFREFGLIAGVGMIAVVLAYTLCLPALLALWAPRAVRHRAQPHSSALRRLAKAPKRGLVVTGIALLAILINVPRLSFDYDFAALQDSSLPAFTLDKAVNGILGRSQTPAVVLTDTPDQARATAAALRAAHDAAGEASTFDFVLTASDLVPGDQAAHHAVMIRLRKALRKAKATWMKTEVDRQRLKAIKKMAKAAPFTGADLPVGVRQTLWGPKADPAKDAGAVLIYPAISFSDGLAVQAFSDQARGSALPDPPPAIAGEVMILADVLALIKAEGFSVLALTLGLILACLWALLGRLSVALMALLPAVLTVTALMGLLPLVGLQLNYLNVVMIPVLFGIAVDGAVHLITRAQEGGELVADLTEVGRNIAGAVLTTALGFGALTLADHPGLFSTGALAILGLALNLLICLVGLTPALMILNRRRTRGATP